MAIKRIPDPTAKSLAGEMKVNKVFGTNKTPPKKKYPTIKKKVAPKKKKGFNPQAYAKQSAKVFGK